MVVDKEVELNGKGLVVKDWRMLRGKRNIKR